MSASKYIKLTNEEKRTLEQSLAEDFGENRISFGAYIKYLAEQRGDANE